MTTGCGTDLLTNEKSLASTGIWKCCEMIDCGVTGAREACGGTIGRDMAHVANDKSVGSSGDWKRVYEFCFTLSYATLSDASRATSECTNILFSAQGSFRLLPIDMHRLRARCPNPHEYIPSLKTCEAQFAGAVVGSSPESSPRV